MSTKSDIEAAKNLGLEFTQVDLQKLFIYLTNQSIGGN